MVEVIIVNLRKKVKKKMSHKKAGSSGAHQAHHTKGRRRGLKKGAGQKIKAGNIIIRQKGTKYLAGRNIGIGRDYTLFALKDGILVFRKRKMSGTKESRTIVEIKEYVR